MRCKYWNDMGHPDYKVNVNLSVVQLLQNDIVEQIAEVISETGIDPKNLTLEVTESLAINDMNRMKKILADIQDGSFAKEFLLDMSDAGSQVHFNAMRKIAAEHPAEVVGKEIRKLYSWSDEDKLINN